MNSKFSTTLSTRIYYTIKPAIPRYLQLMIRRKIVLFKREQNRNVWPIDESASSLPNCWKGWREKKKFALVLMHDVDTQFGHDKCRYLMDLEEKLGFRSTFNFVAERYKISKKLFDEIRLRGFGIGVHGLKHDGKLFSNKKIFLKRAKKINKYLSEWGTCGFSAPSMLRNLHWMQDLNIEYATSTFDTDPFEPQPDGVKRIFPFWVQTDASKHGYIEIPYTMPQDFTLFIIMKEKNTDVWKNKLNWIADKRGMVLLNTHPDYMNYGSKKNRSEEYNARLYCDFLKWIKTVHCGDYWHALTIEVADYYAEWRVSKYTKLINSC